MYLGVVLASVVFLLFMDAVGTMAIESRSLKTVAAMSEFEHSLASGQVWDQFWQEAR